MPSDFHIKIRRYGPTLDLTPAGEQRQPMRLLDLITPTTRERPVDADRPTAPHAAEIPIRLVTPGLARTPTACLPCGRIVLHDS
ncbi:hypothetical protein [Streptomyces erythrochromogenes]|uniref:hypothetical protein n=1 Tax=Streptomyces erythrochromogenes TaxID=285574 RepID=UPI0036930D1C